MDILRQELDRLYRANFGKMVGSLLYFSSDIDLETAEDIVQDSFSAALSAWTKESIPSNPEGWIYKVCKNKALNKIREGKKFRNLFAAEDFPSGETALKDSAFDDPSLKLLFACAHPDLSPKTQVVITLKYVVGLKVEAISKILGMTEDGVDKLLLRARQKIRDQKILLEAPDGAALTPRLSIVHKIIYLIFNEGYKSSWGKEMLREELCEEALLMNRALLKNGIGNTETAALNALMLFNAARLKARFSVSGQLLALEEQDRSLWNPDLIKLGCEFLLKSRGESISTYHYEASIACLHCSAKSFDTTDWNSITNLYQKLLNMYRNPFVELNFAIALYYSGQKQKAFEMINELQKGPFLSQYYLLNASLGKMYFLEGEGQKAKTYFLKTLQQTKFQVERDFIQKMIDQIDGREGNASGLSPAHY